MLIFAKGSEPQGRDDWLESWLDARVERLRADLRPVSEWVVDDSEPKQQFDLVLVIDRQSVRKATIDDPYPIMTLLSRATRSVSPGGHLIWSYLYAFNGDVIESLLEPAAIYRNLVLRGMKPRTNDPPPSRVEIYNHPDTLFLHHRMTGGRHKRIVRVLGCLGR